VVVVVGAAVVVTGAAVVAGASEHPQGPSSLQGHVSEATYLHASLHFESVAPRTFPSLAEQVGLTVAWVVVPVVAAVVVPVDAAVVATGVVVMVVVAVLGEGEPDLVTAMSAQFQNSSPKDPSSPLPDLQQEFPQVAQLATQKGHQSAGFQPSATKAALLR